jgi:hypothetical protein
MMGQEFVYLITRDADLMKIMRVMADDAFIFGFAVCGLLALRKRLILATGAFVVGQRCSRRPK